MIFVAYRIFDRVVPPGTEYRLRLFDKRDKARLFVRWLEKTGFQTDAQFHPDLFDKKIFSEYILSLKPGKLIIIDANQE